MATTLFPPRLLPSGDSAITVEFSRNIDDEANRRVLALDRTLARDAIAGVTETVPTYRSLLVHYDPVQIDFEELGGNWWRLRNDRCRRHQNRRRRIPVAMAASTASISRMSRKRLTPRRMTSGAPCCRRLPHCHDRLYARLVLSQRPRGVLAYAAAAEPAAVDASGTISIGGVQAGCNALPGRADGICSVGPRSEPINCIATRLSCWSQAIP